MLHVMRKIILLFLLSCFDQGSLGRICPSRPCYTGEIETLNVGICHAGIPICDDKMNVVECRGEVLPSEDICDSLDNLCIGHADYIPDIYFQNFNQGEFGLEEYPCAHLGACFDAHVECV